MATPQAVETKAQDLTETLRKLAADGAPKDPALNGLADALRELTTLCGHGSELLLDKRHNGGENGSSPKHPSTPRLWSNIDSLVKAGESAVQRSHGLAQQLTTRFENQKPGQSHIGFDRTEVLGLSREVRLIAVDLDMSLLAATMSRANPASSTARQELVAKINAVQRSHDEQASQPDPLGILHLTEEAVTASIQSINATGPLKMSPSPAQHLAPSDLNRTVSGGSQSDQGGLARSASQRSRASSTPGQQQVSDWIRDLETLRLAALTPQTSSGESHMPSIFSASDGDTVVTDGSPPTGSLAMFDVVELSDDGSDEGFAVDVAKEALESGQEAFERGDWAEADSMLREALHLANDLPIKHRSMYDTYDLQYKLAVCAYYTKEPEAAQVALLSFTKLVPSSDTHRMKLCDVGHLLAQTYTRVGRLEQARSTCESTLKGRRAVLGKHHQAFYESLALLARICELQDRLSQAKVYVRMIPVELQRTLCSKFSNLGQLPAPARFEGLRKGLESDAGSDRDVDSVLAMSPPRMMSPSLSIVSSPPLSPGFQDRKDHDGQGHYELAAEQRFNPAVPPSATHPAFRTANQPMHNLPHPIPTYSLFPNVQPLPPPPQFHPVNAQYPPSQPPPPVPAYSQPRADIRNARPASPTPSTMSNRGQVHGRSVSTPGYHPSPLQGVQLAPPMPQHAQSFSYPPPNRQDQSNSGLPRSAQVSGAPWPPDVPTRRKWLDGLDILFSGDLESFVLSADQGKRGSGPTSVHLAALFGDVERATAFLSSGGSLTATCKIPIDKARSVDIVNPLHFAIGARQNAMIKLLIERGAKLEPEKNSKNPSPVAYLLWNAWLNATDYGGIDEVLSVLNNLLAFGWKINSPIYHTGWTILHFATYLPQDKLALRDAACRFLMGSGADVNALSTNGRTPLHIAANNNATPETICMLLSRDASMVNHADKSGDTALHGAARYRALNPSRVSTDVLNALCKAGANVSAKNKDGRTPLEVAEFYKDFEAVSLLRAHFKAEDQLPPGRSASVSSAGSDPRRRLSSFASRFRV
ncbi:ankyrin [Polychaeton citri CBS 116435]|uniref:Ankyrin n=1 Tax=Polychaeton citri CBS 116435 TaxID=1314669 RepID=A0A9P4Q8X7_9PEZI|nr:ankyrin [Polychaeton citri CBS 116435]